jgi:hypothetical protein
MITDPEKTLYNVNLFGKKKVKIVKIDYMYSAGTDKMIGIKSDILRIPYGNIPYFVFSTNSSFQVGNIHSDLEFETNFVGNLDLEIIDTLTDYAPLAFVKMCLTLDIQNAE